MKTLIFLKVFTEPVRLRILNILKKLPLSVGEIVSILSQSQANISHHLKQLADIGLIYVQKKGSLNFYKIHDAPNVPKVIQSLWDEIDEIINEIPEKQIDEKKLLEILTDREKKGIYLEWESWRKIQPDLPYTFEFAFHSLPKVGCALDIGCGDGNLMIKLNTSFKQIIGIDISTEQLLKAKTLKSFAVIQASGYKLPFMGGSMDVVFF